MRGNRTPSYPALPECSAVKTSMVAPKFTLIGMRRWRLYRSLSTAHRGPSGDQPQSTTRHHFSFFERLGRVQFVRRAGWNRTNVLLYPKQADYHFPTARGTIFI